ncbi:MAG: DUF4292 domain-containing protein, partial [Marinirhabdus sp.]
KIWVKASILGITLAKALITPNRVRYYETVGNTYFEGNFSLLSHWLGTHITFEKAEAILLGQSIFNLTEGRFTSEATAAGYKIVPETQPENFIYGLTLNAENFKVRSETVSQPAENRLTVLRYTGYGAINGTVFPKTVAVQSSKNGERTNVGITYRKIETNVPVGFQYSVPKGYAQLVLK